MTTITLEHITKRFAPEVGSQTQGVIAVNNLSLKIASGDVLAVLGPSGCGKSTLLRLVAGILEPDSGTVLYDNIDLRDIPIRDRGIGMVFQEGALIPHWEARLNIGFFLRLRQREQEIPERLARIASITGIGLDKLLDRRPSQLSGGERQRVGIARALARDLRVLLFDEPFANLDAHYRAEARIELKRLLNALPTTSIYVTHDQTEAVALSHRIAVMREGRLEQVGTYQQLYHSPVNIFVASFIGPNPINFFPGRVQNGRWYGENFGDFPLRRDLPDGTRVTAGIRPENVRLQSGGVYGVVDHITPLLAERSQLVSVHLAGERWSLVASLDQPVEIGSTLQCALQPDALLFFDDSTGQRIG